MKFTGITLLFIIATTFTLYSQTYTIEGTVLDEKDKSSMPSVIITMRPVGDTTNKYMAATDMDGKFKIDVPKPGKYSVEFHSMSYERKTRELDVTNPVTNVGEITMKDDAINLKEGNVEGKIPLAVQNGDTTQYNADAYKVNKDANAEDLVTKMPGLTVENGVVKSNGEDVKKVLVDGKEFFGDDAMMTLKNFPADVIDKIQVFDKLSDQAEFSGFNDGNTSKTINIVTKKDKLNGQFGKIYGGLGTGTGLDYRYQVGGNINLFEGNRKISIVGMSNNINQQNFSSEDLVGVSSSSSSSGGNRGGGMGGGMFGGGRPGGGGNPTNNFLVGQQNGIANTHAFGINYTDVWGKKKNLTFSGSYFFNVSDNDKNQNTNREYLLTPDSSIFYKELSQSNSINYNHRVNLRFEYKIDSMNTLTFTPKFSYQQNNSSQTLNATNSLLDGTIYNSSNSYQTSMRTGYNGGGEILYRHRFKKQGRTLMFNASGNYSWNDNNSDLVSQNIFFTDTSTTVDSVNQRSNQVTSGYKIGAGAGYTEPVGKSGQIFINYNFNYDWNTSDKATNRLNPADSTYSILDSLLSNSYTNANITNRGTVGYGLRGEKFNFNVGVSYENIMFSGEQRFPGSIVIERMYHNVLPNANFRFRFTKTQSLNIMYRTSTNLPSVNQLQTVINNSNPLILSTGNENLLQSYSHIGMIRYNATNTDKATALFTSLAYTYTQNYIANATYIAENDTVLSNGTRLGQGSQISFPVNMQGYMNARGMFTYAFPVKKIKTNISLTSNVNYNRLPGMINMQENFSNTISFSQGIGFTSNISEKIDFNISYNAGYNVVFNTLRSQNNSNYFNQTASVKINWVIHKGLFVNTNLNHYYYNGLAGGFDQNVFLWNASAGYKFLKDESLELKATVFDILGQNNSVSRTITETYIEDQTSNVLTRYFMVTLTYNLKNFAKADEKKDKGMDKTNDKNFNMN